MNQSKSNADFLLCQDLYWEIMNSPVSKTLEQQECAQAYFSNQDVEGLEAIKKELGIFADPQQDDSFSSQCLQCDGGGSPLWTDKKLKQMRERSDAFQDYTGPDNPAGQLKRRYPATEPIDHSSLSDLDAMHDALDQAEEERKKGKGIDNEKSS